MAKIVLAGRSDCPYFARCELLGDRMEKNLRKFKLHKIIIQPEKWEKWLTVTCAERGWSFTRSPIVWRELIDRGGKGVLIGGANDFQEYAKAYYDVESQMNSFDMLTVSAENKKTKDALDEEERAFNAQSQPVNVCITNASSATCYYLLQSLSSGRVLGPGVELTIRLLVTAAQDVEQVEGVAMEAEDLAHGLLRDVRVCTNLQEAFHDCGFVIMLDSLLKTAIETDKQWLDRNAELCTKYADIINRVALKTCKIVLCGNGPVNFNAMLMVQRAPNINKKNIVAIASVIENQAKSVVGDRLSINPAGVINLVVWGNINGRRYFDVSNCRIQRYKGAISGPHWHTVSAVEMIHDNRWLVKDLPWLVSSRQRKVTEALGRQTMLSTANAIAATLQLWCRGSTDKQVYSLGVYSEGLFNIPEGMFLSQPVQFDPKGSWTLVEDIQLMQETKDGINEAIAEITSHFQLYFGSSDMKDSTVTSETFVSESKTVNTLPGSFSADKLDALHSGSATTHAGSASRTLDAPISQDEIEGPENEAEGPENEAEGPENEAEGPENEAEGPENEVEGPENEAEGSKDKDEGPEKEAEDKGEGLEVEATLTKEKPSQGLDETQDQVMSTDGDEHHPQHDVTSQQHDDEL